MARMRSEGYSIWSVLKSLSICLSVCLSVYDYSRTTGYEAAYERYQQLQCYKGMKIKCGDFAETTAFERYGVKTSEKAIMSTGLPRPGLARSAHRGQLIN